MSNVDKWDKCGLTGEIGSFSLKLFHETHLKCTLVTKSIKNHQIKNFEQSPKLALPENVPKSFF